MGAGRAVSFGGADLIGIFGGRVSFGSDDADAAADASIVLYDVEKGVWRAAGVSLGRGVVGTTPVRLGEEVIVIGG